MRQNFSPYLWYVFYLICLTLSVTDACSGYGQFYGGSLSYTLNDVGGQFVVISQTLFEPRDEKTEFCQCKNKDADQLSSISAFRFARRIVQFLFYLNPKLNFKLLTISYGCTDRFVSAGRKPKLLIFFIYFNHIAKQY